MSGVVESFFQVLGDHERLPRIIELLSIPSKGVRIVPATVPTSWQPGDEHPFQALVGPLGNPNSVLSNPKVLTVE